VAVAQSGVLEHKSGNISETHKDKVTMRNSPTLFRTVPPPPSKASSSPRLGVSNPNPKLQWLLYQELVKLRTSNLARTFTGSIRIKTH